MNTTLRLFLIAGLVVASSGAAEADPGLRSLIQIEDRPYYEEPSVEIWTDRDWYAVGEAVRVTVRVDRPSFVTVYNIDAAGYVRRLTDDPRGVWVTPGRPLSLPQRSRARLVATGPGGVEELVAVASPVKFASCEFPFYGDGSTYGMIVPDRDREGYVRRVNSRLVGHRECAAKSVARVTFLVEPLHRPEYSIHIGGGMYIDFGFHIPIGAAIYVDGVYCGRGPSALGTHRSGKHKVTVRTEEGRKFTKIVNFDTARRFRTDVRADGKSHGDETRYDRSKKR